MSTESTSLSKSDREIFSRNISELMTRIVMLEENVRTLRKDQQDQHTEFMKLNYDVIQIAEHAKVLTGSLSLLMNVISLTHMRDAFDHCVPNCIGCAFTQTVKGFKAAEKLMEVANAR